MSAPATFNQRRALFNMYTALGWDRTPIRKMSKFEASRAMKDALEEIEDRGFPKPETEEDNE